MKVTLFILLFFLSLFSLQAQKSKAETLIQEGIELHDAEEYQKAIEKFKEAVKADPHSIKAKYEMSLSYLDLKDYEHAAQLSTEVINSNDKNLSIGAYAVKSEALAQMNKIDDAILLLHEGLKKHGDTYLLHFNLALNYYTIGDVKNALKHVTVAINCDKSHSGAFLLNAYALNDSGLWVQSILSFQMFLLLEPDSIRSKNAFEEMLQTMRIKPLEEKPVERSFIQLQLMQNQSETQTKRDIFSLHTTEEGLNQSIVYHAITTTLDSLKQTETNEDLFNTFKVVNKVIIEVLNKENNDTRGGNVLWTFYIPFFTEFAKSECYTQYTRYISVSYFPESLEWWNNNKEEAQKFINWFEKGES